MGPAAIIATAAESARDQLGFPARLGFRQYPDPFQRQSAFDGDGEEFSREPGTAVVRAEPETRKVEVEVSGGDQIGEFGAMGGDQGAHRAVRRASEGEGAGGR